MKVAIIHDSLAEFGGGERVIQALLSLYPQADLYVGFYENKILETHFPSFPKKNIHATIAQNTFLMSRSSLFQLLSPFIWRTLRMGTYDLIISSSAFLLCNLTPTDKTLHIQYIHSPPKNLFLLIDKTPFQKIFPYHLLLAPLYTRVLNKNKFLITNSVHMQHILKEICSVTANVIYPPVRIPKTIKKNTLGYYLIVSRIDTSKSIELAIEACNELHVPLKIAGKSNDEQYELYLKSIAGPTITFLGEQTDEEIDRLYDCAIAFIFTAKNEDFGIAPVEAMAHGIPVVAYYGGGLKETIVENKTGIFFHEHTVTALKKTLLKIKKITFKAEDIRAHANSFSSKNFIQHFSKYVSNAKKYASN